MSASDFLKLGDWNAICFECGMKKKASSLRKNWQGYYVCAEHWESRQPQDFARGVPDGQAPPWTQPAPADYFAPICTPNSSSAYPGFAGPGCCIPGYVSPQFDPTI